MDILKRWSLLILILVGALACYSMGFSTGLWVFLVLGVLLELAFWAGAIGFKREKD